jgi:glyoxylase-like metal-dependent hydrolase (beta-lactamase superfamily II)
MITIGDFEIVSVETGTFRLDGGAMFGVVPKVLWAGHEDVDEQNRILLSTRTLVAVSGDREHVILTDTGNGTKWPAKEAERFGISTDGQAIENALREHWGLSEKDVTDVIVTHLHFDHNGGLTEWDGEPGGKTRVRFAGARHWIHRGHWQHVLNPTEKDRASFLERDYDILDPAGVMKFVDGEEPEAPWGGVRFFVSHGHTPYQLLPVFFDDDRELIFTGDVFPTSSHLRVPYVMAYDLEPLKTIEEKKRILQRCKEHGAWLAFPHDHRLAGGRIDVAGKRPFVAKVSDL